MLAGGKVEVAEIEQGIEIVRDELQRLHEQGLGLLRRHDQPEIVQRRGVLRMQDQRLPVGSLRLRQCALLVEFDRLTEQAGSRRILAVLRAAGPVAQQSGEIVAGDGVVGLNAQGLFVAGDRLALPAQFLQCVPQMVERDRIVGTQAEQPFVAGGRLAEMALLGQNDAGNEQGCGMVSIEPEGALAKPEGVLEAPRLVMAESLRKKFL